ncbi:sensor domain-containing protein [Mycobacterium sp. M1]|uniref:Sensor domain-containing protein n=1 Tax=Mycolicibacter acidiphilus TaxID=2835306 RepID=A0ABS5REK2_9MYCO|nr:sensor domain-containing protein [Mycolicibacter acidiphilus]MBS9532715.1 sensor domain-containing protein [Mycolicibacter acidiphilus]
MLFVSYASHDRPRLDNLLHALRDAGHRVWLDEELGGGDAWWHAILANIRACEVFVVALSNNSLMSKPCQAELRYARALRRPILPVQIGPVDSVRVTPLAATQILDYRNPSPAADSRLAAALRHQQVRADPLPAPLPAEPEVPFAYLMRLADTLAGAELSHGDQAALVSELRARLDEDRSDPSARSDIIRLMYLLRDRSDVTWRTRTDVDTLLAANEPGLDPPPDGPLTVPFTGPQPVVVASPRPPEQAPATDGPAVRRTRRLPVKWLVGATAVVTVAGTVVGAGVLHHPDPGRSRVALVSDAEINATMGTTGMQTVQGGVDDVKQNRLVDVSPPDCAASLYPGLDRTYADSGAGGVTWGVLERPGGLQRAGVDGNPFVDQDTAAFSPGTDQAGAFVRKSAETWTRCAGKTVAVAYPDHNVYRWTVGDVTGAAPEITQTYALADDPGYTCQRVLSAVAEFVVDVKACSTHATGEAVRIADKIAADLTGTSTF